MHMHKNRNMTFRVHEGFAEEFQQVADEHGLSRTEWLYRRVAEDRERSGLTRHAAEQFIAALVERFGRRARLEFEITAGLDVRVSVDGQRVKTAGINPRAIGDLRMLAVADDAERVKLYLCDPFSDASLRVAELHVPARGGTTITLPVGGLSAGMQSLDVEAPAPAGTLKR